MMPCAQKSWSLRQAPPALVVKCVKLRVEFLERSFDKELWRLLGDTIDHLCFLKLVAAGPRRDILLLQHRELGTWRLETLRRALLLVLVFAQADCSSRRAQPTLRSLVGRLRRRCALYTLARAPLGFSAQVCPLARAGPRGRSASTPIPPWPRRRCRETRSVLTCRVLPRSPSWPCVSALACEAPIGPSTLALPSVVAGAPG
jgi:hypothetical protein